MLIPFLALITAPALAAPTIQDARADAIETALRAQMAGKAAPGAAYAVVLDGRIAIARGLGTEASDRFETVTADTAFVIGPVTKTLTAAAALRADEAGVLDLDAPVGRVIEGLDAADGTPFLRQFLWAFGRASEPARDVPHAAEPPAGATAGR